MRVTWSIDIDSDIASTPHDAARAALEMLQDPDSIAHVFEVDGTEVDLDEDRGCGCVSRNYPDRKWRIACDPRPGDHTYKTRDEAAAAELELMREARS